MTESTHGRRVFLKGSFAAGVAGVAVSSGILKPTSALAEWPAAVFEAKGMKEALGGNEGTTSADITIKALDIAEDSAVVQVSVESTLPNIDTISILVKENQRPLSAVFKLAPEVLPNVTTRIKMAKTSDIVAVLKSGEKTFNAAKEVKVTIGGCGG